MADELVPRPALAGDTDVDVAIVGAGYTGLWTAYYLAVADPSLRIAVLESEIAGFGASGRNGGWCSALLPAVPGRPRPPARPGPGHRAVPGDAVHGGRGRPGRAGRGHRLPLRQGRHRRAGPVGRAARPRPARGRRGPLVRLRRGRPGAARRRVGAAALRGRRRCWAARSRRTAPRIHPARLVRGLARAVQRRGVRVYEQTRATALQPGAVQTDARHACGPTSWCARPRGTPPSCPATVGRWRRSTR